MTEEEWLEGSNGLRLLEFALDCKDDEYFVPGQFDRVTERKVLLASCACVRTVWDFLERRDSRRAVEATEQWADLPYSRQLKTAKHLKLLHRRAREAVDLLASNSENITYACLARDLTYACLARDLFLMDRVNMVAAEVLWTLDSGAETCTLLRDVFGNPWRRYRMARSRLEAADYGSGMADRPQERWLEVPGSKAWLNRQTTALADQAYQEASPETGWLNQDTLSVLADALVDSGCPEEETAELPCLSCGGTGCSRAPAGDYARTWPCDECGTDGRVKILMPNQLIAHLRSGRRHVKGCWVVDLILGKE